MPRCMVAQKNKRNGRSSVFRSWDMKSYVFHRMIHEVFTLYYPKLYNVLNLNF